MLIEVLRTLSSPTWTSGKGFVFAAANNRLSILPSMPPPQVMQDMLMDVLRALSSPNLDIRQKTLDLALDLISARNIDEVNSLQTGNRT